jgi:hypothetical protein
LIAVVGLVYVAAQMPDAGEAEDGKRFPSDLTCPEVSK